MLKLNLTNGFVSRIVARFVEKWLIRKLGVKLKLTIAEAIISDDGNNADIHLDVGIKLKADDLSVIIDKL